MKNKRKTFVLAFMFICFVGIITTIFLISDWKKDVSTNLLIKQEVEKYVYKDKRDEIEINFDELKKLNSDTVGYIEVPNTNANYVVVKGKNNDYYLKHDFNKEYNVAGWIFADYRNKVDGTDNNLVIFGHNTKDGSMFGSLSNLLDEDFITNKDNQIITFITDKGKKQYQIFSVYTIKPEEYYITTSFKDNEFEIFKKRMKERSIYKIDVDIENKNIITLSTCQNSGTKRLVIHAVEI